MNIASEPILGAVPLEWICSFIRRPAFGALRAALIPIAFASRPEENTFSVHRAQYTSRSA